MIGIEISIFLPILTGADDVTSEGGGIGTMAIGTTFEVA